MPTPQYVPRTTGACIWQYHMSTKVGPRVPRSFSSSISSLVLCFQLTMASFKGYDLVVAGSGFAGSMATLNFLEECKKQHKSGRVALVEVGKDGERCGASRWTMAYLRLDKNLDFGEPCGIDLSAC